MSAFYLMVHGNGLGKGFQNAVAEYLADLGFVCCIRIALLCCSCLCCQEPCTSQRECDIASGIMCGCVSALKYLHCVA